MLSWVSNSLKEEAHADHWQAFFPGKAVHGRKHDLAGGSQPETASVALVPSAGIFSV
jgi:hypothetical protein